MVPEEQVVVLVPQNWQSIRQKMQLPRFANRRRSRRLSPVVAAEERVAVLEVAEEAWASFSVAVVSLHHGQSI